MEALLSGNVACGVNLKGLDDGVSWRHFSGNFWWARCDHINRLPPPLDLVTPYFKQHSGMNSDSAEVHAKSVKTQIFGAIFTVIVCVNVYKNRLLAVLVSLKVCSQR